MATNISYILIHKSKFFEIFLNDLQTVSKEYQKRLKKVGILRVEMMLLITLWHDVDKTKRPFYRNERMMEFQN